MAASLRKNVLLQSVPPDVWERLVPHLDLVELPLGAVLHEPGSALSHAYFPTTAIVSLLGVLENGASAETAVVGLDGVVGVALFMGGSSLAARAVVHGAGHAFRLPAQVLRHECDAGGPLMHLLLRYTQALITQMAQTAVCNRHHTVEQQLCRWLLLSLDRHAGNELVLTQDLIATMLGVRREGITHAASTLQRAGIIRYSRGRITILDRPALEHRVCECYRVVKRECDRLVPTGVQA